MYKELTESSGLPLKLTTFENEGHDQMIVQTNIPFYSLCEHHMVPFFGKAYVAYIPGARIIGLSKLTRVVQFCALGLQNQERITTRAAGILRDVVGNDVAVMLRARHLCMEMRGVKSPGAITATTDIHGRFKQSEVRAEFLRHIPTTPI